MTGWMFKTFWARSYGPIPKAVLFWSGKLMRLAIGFCAAFANAAVLASSDSAAGFWSVAAGVVCPAGAEDSGSAGCPSAATSIRCPASGRRFGIRRRRARGRTWRGQDNLIPLETEGTVREACQCVDVHIRLAVHLDNRSLARLAGYDKRQVLRRILRPGQPRQDHKRNQHQY